MEGGSHDVQMLRSSEPYRCLHYQQDVTSRCTANNDFYPTRLSSNMSYEVMVYLCD